MLILSLYARWTLSSFHGSSFPSFLRDYTLAAMVSIRFQYYIYIFIIVESKLPLVDEMFMDNFDMLTKTLLSVLLDSSDHSIEQVVRSANREWALFVRDIVEIYGYESMEKIVCFCFIIDTYMEPNRS